MAEYPYMPYLNKQPGSEYAPSTRSFQGCPSLAVSPGGRLWAFWLGGGINEGPDNYVILTTSGDGGFTWSEPKLVVDPPYRASEPGAWVDPQGRLWLFWSMHPVDIQRPGGQLWAMVADDAEAENPSWQAPRLLAQELSNFNKPTVLSDGTWIVPALSTQWASLRNHMKPPVAPIGHLSRPLISKDGGQTFTAGGELPVPDAMRNFDEYMAVEKKDGTLWVLSRTIPAPNGIGESLSSDGGQTWTQMRHVPGIKNTASRIFFRRLATGNLLLVKNGALDDGSGRNRLTAFISTDDGQNWGGGLVLDERTTVSYPDGGQAEDGTIYIAYDRERTGAKEILLATFTEEDVAAGQIVSPGSSLKRIVNKATGTPDSSRPQHLSEGLAHAVAVRGGRRQPEIKAVPLVRGESPELDLNAYSSLPLVPGQKLFSDRAYTLSEVPQRLEGKQFVYMSIDGGSLHVLAGGMLYVASPSPARDKNSSLEASLLSQGFTKADVPEFQAFPHVLGSNDETKFTIYQRRVDVGEVIHGGKIGLFIF